MRKTTEEFIEEAKLIHGDKYDYSLVDYKNNNTKVKIKCNTCGIIFEQKPRVHLENKGCKNCGNKQKAQKNSKSQKKTTDWFLKKAISKWGIERFDYSLVEYKGANEKVKIKCNTCGNIFSIIPRGHLRRDGGCKECAIEKVADSKRLTQEEILKRCSQRKEYDCSKIKYVDAYTKIEIVCKKHGSFWILPYNFYGNKQDCRKCILEKHGSKTEKKIFDLLEEAKIDFEYQQTFEDLKDVKLLSYDFYIPSKKILIEVQGHQHYKFTPYFHKTIRKFHLQKHHDWLKRQYAKKNGLQIIEIDNRKKNINFEKIISYIK